MAYLTHVRTFGRSIQYRYMLDDSRHVSTRILRSVVYFDGTMYHRHRFVREPTNRYLAHSDGLRPVPKKDHVATVESGSHGLGKHNHHRV
jgi:hypothetical protein